jgi:2-oxoisovalerate dehydrogenase E1 component
VVVPLPYRPAASDLDGPSPADRHRALGLSADVVVEVYRRMVLARRIDERAWNWNRQGRVPFVVPCEGHEATQVGAATMLRVGHDWVCPYYRDLPLMVGLGLPTIGLLAHVLWRADDPHSGGRQMPGHWNDVGRRVLSSSSCIATQIPHALGLGLAEQLRGSDAVALAAFGEGATAEGDFHEAVNWAACHLVPVVFLCENNGWAISVPAAFETPVAVAQRATGYGIPGVRVDGNDVFAVMGAVARAVGRARAGGGPSIVEAMTYRFRPHTSDDDDRRYRTREEVDAWRTADPLDRTRRYLLAHGLADEQALVRLEASAADEVAAAAAVVEMAAAPDAATAAAHVYRRPLAPPRPRPSARPRPAPVARAVEDAITVGAPGPTGSATDGRVTVVEAVRRTLDALLAEDERVVVFGQDVGARGGVFLAADGLTDRHPGRVFDAPIAESAIVGAAIGLAIAGWRPIAEIQFADYTHPAFDQLVSEASRIHYRTNGAVSVPLVLRAPCGPGVHGGQNHSQTVEAFYAHVPGLKVVMPSTPADMAGLLRSAYEDPDPVLVFEHKRCYRQVRGLLPDGAHRVPIGEAVCVRPGRDATVVTYGFLRHVAHAAVEALAAAGDGDVELLDLRTISPLDRDAIQASVSRTGRCLVVTEDTFSFGVAAEVAAWVQEACFSDLDAPVERLCVPDVPLMPFAAPLEDALLPTQPRIEAALRQLLAW